MVRSVKEVKLFLLKSETWMGEPLLIFIIAFLEYSLESVCVCLFVCVCQKSMFVCVFYCLITQHIFSGSFGARYFT